MLLFILFPLFYSQANFSFALLCMKGYPSVWEAREAFLDGVVIAKGKAMDSDGSPRPDTVQILQT